MKFYKILHKPTGLFYRPYAGPHAPNLVKRQGKVYERKPKIKQLGATYKHPAEDYPYFERKEIIEEEWEVLEFEVRTM